MFLKGLPAAYITFPKQSMSKKKKGVIVLQTVFHAEGDAGG